MSVTTITHESGQTGMFFGSLHDLDVYTEIHNNSKSTRDYIMAAAKDYLVTSTPTNLPRTFTQRFKANIGAIEVIKALRVRNSSATRKEQEHIAKYVGWGAVSQVFDERNTKELARRTKLQDLLSTEEYSSARKSTVSAFYTPYFLVAEIYKMLRSTGFESGNVLDPAAGVGGLISPMPPEMYKNSNVSLVELENITGEILTHLFPNASVFAGKGFEEIKFKANYDLVIQNSPFGSTRILDNDNKDLSGQTIHNYFLSKGIKLLRLGGLMVAVVSTSFLDSKNSKARELISKSADLKGALRLPKNVFLESAGANASVDILLFQKTSQPVENPTWLNVTEQNTANGDNYYLNDYFVSNPQLILGDMVCEAGVIGKQVQCISVSNDLIGDIKTAFLSSFEKDIYIPPALKVDEVLLEPINDVVSNSDYIEAGGYALTDSGLIAIRVNDDEFGNPVFETQQQITGKRAQRIKAAIPVKQSLSKLLDLERTDANSDKIELERANLNKVYDQFVKSFGYLQESANRAALSKDSFYANLASLEIDFESGVSREQTKRLGLEKKKPSAKKAEIFNYRIIKPWKMPETADNALDALWIVWNAENKIDLNKVGSLCGKKLHEIKYDLLGSVIFLNPETSQYEFSETFLSGDVKSKLKITEAALKSNPELMHSYKALKKVIPEDIEAIDIGLEFNAGWLPADIVKEFVEQLLKCTVDAKHVLGQWFVKAKHTPSLINFNQYGVDEYPAEKVIERMYSGRNLIVKRTLPNGDRVVDKESTMHIEGVYTEIKARFDDWVWSCEERRERLEKIYNEQFNRFVRPQYTGENLVFPDQSSKIELRQHQKTCVRRSLEQGSLLLDVIVGGGKTFTIATIVHEWHRLGIKERTAVVLPNHLVQQIAVEWLRLYPLEKLLVLSPEDMSSSKRKETLNRIKTGSKIVLIPESTFKAIPLPLEAEQEILAEEIEETRLAISILEKSFSVKRLETKLSNLDYKLQQLTNRSAKDETLDFDELGFDSICVDEAHAYKNLRFNTVALADVRGIGNQDGSQRSWDLFIKCQFLNRKYDHAGVVFSTGTPISNSIIELYTMQKFLAYDKLKAMGLHWLDSWADVYTSCSTEFEVDATGTNYKPTTRLRSFINLPELQKQFGCIAETVTMSELKSYLPKLEGGFDLIPPLATGKPQTIFVDPSDQQADYINNNLMERAKDFRKSPIDNDNMLLLMFHARCASLDMKILDPSYDDNNNSKAEACADKVIELYKKYDNEKATQIIFCDLSTPNKGKSKLRGKINELKELALQGDEKAALELEKIGVDQVFAANSDFSVYDDLKNKLVERGVNINEIAFAQDYKTPKAKTELYLQINEGIKRVVIASTAMMGTGANINKRAVAVHHLDPTYKPSDMEQRTGRVERQNNMLYEADPANYKVHVYYYATRNSLDAYLYQTLENKAKWIEAFKAFKTTDRKMEDLGNDSLTFAEIKAEVSGNPLILEHLQTTKLVEKLAMQQKRHQQQQHRYQRSLTNLKYEIENHHRAIESINKDKALYEQNKLPEGEFKAVIDGYTIPKYSMAGEMVMKKVQEYNFYKSNKMDETVMKYCGFTIQVSRAWGSLVLLILGAQTYQIELKKGKNTSPLSVMNSITKSLAQLDSFINIRKEHIVEAEKNILSAKEQIGASFEKLDELIQAKQRLNEIKHVLLSDDKPEVKEELEVNAAA